MDDVTCYGDEYSLTECSWTSDHNCGHSEDVGVYCGGEYTPGHNVTNNTTDEEKTSNNSSDYENSTWTNNSSDWEEGNNTSGGQIFYDESGRFRLVENPYSITEYSDHYHTNITKVQGRIEVLNGAEWGTVCDDSFSDNAA